MRLSALQTRRGGPPSSGEGPSGTFPFLGSVTGCRRHGYQLPRHDHPLEILQKRNIHKEHGSLPNHIARTLTAHRICLGRSKSSILI